MASFNPVELDFDEMQVKLTLKDGEKLILEDESFPTAPVPELASKESLCEEPVCGAVLFLNRISMGEQLDPVVPEPVQQILDKFPPVFSAPTTLP